MKKKLLLLLIVCSVLAGCENPIHKAIINDTNKMLYGEYKEIKMSNVERLELGMPKKKVYKILGNKGKLKIDDSTDNGREYTVIYKVKSGKRYDLVVLTFDGDYKLKKIATL